MIGRVQSGRLFGSELSEWVGAAIRRRLGLVILCSVAVPALSVLSASLQGGYGAEATVVFSAQPSAVERALPPPAPELKSSAVLRATAARLERGLQPMSAGELDRRLVVIQPEGDEQQAVLRATAGSRALALEVVQAWADALLERRRRQVRAGSERLRQQDTPAARGAAASATAAAPDVRLLAAPEAVGFRGGPGAWTVGVGALVGILLALVLAAREGTPLTSAELWRATGLPILARLTGGGVDALEARRLAIKLDLLGHRSAQIALTASAATGKAAQAAKRALDQAYREAGREVSVEVVEGAPPHATAVQVLVVTPHAGAPGAEPSSPRPVGLVVVNEEGWA